MFKKFGILFMVSVLTLSATACNSTNNATNENTEQTSSSSSESKSSGKKKYKDITADTTPIGIDNISIGSNEYGRPYLSCKVYKNSGDIEESDISVTFEIFDETGEFRGEITLGTSRYLCAGDSQTISKDWYMSYDEIVGDNKIINEDGSEMVVDTSEILSKYTATVVAIDEVDAEEVEKQERLEDMLYEIESQINNEAFNTALAMLELAKEEFPNEAGLKVLEAQLKDKMAESAATDTAASEEQTEDEQAYDE